MDRLTVSDASTGDRDRAEVVGFGIMYGEFARKGEGESRGVVDSGRRGSDRNRGVGCDVGFGFWKKSSEESLGAREQLGATASAG